MHPRKRIRDAVVARLVDANAEVGDRVFPSRFNPLWEPELPAILVYFRDEKADVFSGAPRRLRRTVPLVVEIIAHAGPALDDEFDAIALDVEKALNADSEGTGSLDGTANDCLYTGTEFSASDEGKVPMGMARLLFDVDYVMDESDTVVPDEFLKANVRIDLAPTDDTIEIEGNWEREET